MKEGIDMDYIAKMHRDWLKKTHNMTLGDLLKLPTKTYIKYQREYEEYGRKLYDSLPASAFRVL